jgi:hypothetical protein
MEIKIDEKNLNILRTINLQIEEHRKNFSLICETLLRLQTADGIKYTVNLEKGIFSEVKDEEINEAEPVNIPFTN